MITPATLLWINWIDSFKNSKIIFLLNIGHRQIYQIRNAVSKVGQVGQVSNQNELLILDHLLEMMPALADGFHLINLEI
jgi:hypothetical protein